MGFFRRLAGPKSAHATGVFPAASSSTATTEHDVLSLVSVSKPAWGYGLETVPGVLPPKAGRGRRIAFAQLATPGLPDLAARLARPEDDLGRLARGLPLWLAETLYFSSNYEPIAVVGSLNKSRHALFAEPWSDQHLRQLVDTAADGLDYVVAGELTDGGRTLVLRLFDAAKARERKAWTLGWTPETADRTLAGFHEHFRLFMEWDGPATHGLAYVPPARPAAWIQTLGASLSLFLAEKNALSADQLVLPPAVLDLAAEHAVTGEAASLGWLTLQARALKQGLLPAPVNVQLYPSPLVQTAQAALG
ncbi:MAG: hypothetical protein JF599_02775 [Verrucomicrobia bacterium]|nr:hypothetical protein [Verrucomicrobiota bacterium]